MSDLLDRRARKKARTRAGIRAVAQRLFAARGFEAVTIADIAAEADVAVQTVFNHFATKEELFFDGRTPWVEGTAEAVRSRSAGVAPLSALREYLVDMVSSLAGRHACPERRNYLATITASPALLAHELELVNEAERRLAEALTEAWSQETDQTAVPDDPATAAALVAATWLAICRVLLTSRRPGPGDGEGRRSAGSTEPVTERMLAELEQWLDLLDPVPAGPARSVTGWPDDVRRAG